MYRLFAKLPVAGKRLIGMDKTTTVLPIDQLLTVPLHTGMLLDAHTYYSLYAWATRASTSQSDPSGLGRWSSQTFNGKGEKR